jgi:hypothetical protein
MDPGWALLKFNLERTLCSVVKELKTFDVEAPSSPTPPEIVTKFVRDSNSLPLRLLRRFDLRRQRRALPLARAVQASR